MKRIPCSLRTVLICLLFTAILTETAEPIDVTEPVELGTTSDLDNKPLDAERTNFVERFNAESLPAFTKTRRFVVVLFNRADGGTFKLNLTFFTIAKSFEPKEVFFVQIDAADYSDSQLASFGVSVTPTVIFYIYGVPKHFAMPFSSENLSEWIEQVLAARPLAVANLDEVHHGDRHYFVHAQQEWVRANEAHFSVLAKLLTPIGLYTGLSRSELQRLSESTIIDQPVVAFREIDSAALDIDKTFSLTEKAKFIFDNEFLPSIECNDKAIRLVLEYRIPALIYFGQGIPTGDNWQAVERAHRGYKDYLLLFYVDLTGSNKRCRFLADFLAVDEPDSLRILDMTKLIRRYKHIGAFQDSELHYFLTNFVEGNLKSFALNEHLRKGQEYKGLLKGNYRLLKAATKRLHENVLIYVYSKRLAPMSEKHARVLRLVRAVTRTNSTFKLYVINHDRNDIDGQFHEKLPFVFLVSRLGKLRQFESKELTDKALLTFLLSDVPYLKLTDPEIDELSGDL